MGRRRARPQNMSIYGDLSERRAPIGWPGRGTWGSPAGPRPQSAPPPTAPPAPARLQGPRARNPRAARSGGAGGSPRGCQGLGEGGSRGAHRPAPPRDCRASWGRARLHPETAWPGAGSRPKSWCVTLAWPRAPPRRLGPKGGSGAGVGLGRWVPKRRGNRELALVTVPPAARTTQVPRPEEGALQGPGVHGADSPSSPHPPPTAALIVPNRGCARICPPSPARGCGLCLLSNHP